MHSSTVLVAQLRCPQHCLRTAIRQQLQLQTSNVRSKIRVAECSRKFEAFAAENASGACAFQGFQVSYSPFFARTAKAKEGHAGRRLQLDAVAGILKLQQRDGA